MRFTKIVATLGPATDTYEGLKRLVKGGMNVARLNFSHGTHDSHGETIDRLQRLRREGRDIAILLDTKGPQIRTGDVSEPVRIRKGEEVIFTAKPTGREKTAVIGVSYNAFTKDARGANTIVIDNGVMEFAITRVTAGGVLAKALDAGTIGRRRHVNLPGARISLPTFTRDDWSDIAFGIERGVDFIAPSFVRNGTDIRELRSFLEKHKSAAHIVAKIETAQAVEHIDDIIRLSDAIMVARGDLGSEVPIELVPGLQDEIVERCRAHGKPVIVATNMLESMIENPMPTRAELTDVAHAAMTQADAVMLSGETAAGKHPFRAIETMRKVLLKTEERSRAFSPAGIDLPRGTMDPRLEQARAATVLAEKMNARAIVVITKLGHTARAVSRFRPRRPVLAFTADDMVRNQLELAWGVDPYLTTLERDPEKTVDHALSIARKHKLIRANDTVIIVSDILTAHKGKGGHVMSVQIRTVR